MIRIGQLKISAWHGAGEPEKQALKQLRLTPEKVAAVSIRKQSLDARKKEDIKYIYTIDVALKDGPAAERLLVEKLQRPNRHSTKQRNVELRNANITYVVPNEYRIPEAGENAKSGKIVVVGSGPAGLFCAYLLAKTGYRPVLIERGAPVEDRVRAVEAFWQTGKLNPNTNVQFGEGGAGTFSDGKLNTVVKDESGRIGKVFQTFAEHGAPADILYKSKPHIGTDNLRHVVKSMREEILACGGEVRFRTTLTDFKSKNGCICAAVVNGEEEIPCDALVLAIGHSARDTFFMLHKKNISMQAKAFAVGLRIEHQQDMIGKSQYGEAYAKLPAADYKVTHTCKDGRGVYSFCMCPGGYVVNASSETKRLAVNGMSNYNRDAKNANSALIVTVTPEDYKMALEEMRAADVVPEELTGIAFQRMLEERAFAAGNGKIPVSKLGDFKNHTVTTACGSVTPSAKGGYQFADLHTVLPAFIAEDIIEGCEAFDKKIAGFGADDAMLSAVESRTSSPVRILRNDEFVGSIEGLYPCGEGAGYAGGITSAAVDGIKVFEAIRRKYKPV